MYSHFYGLIVLLQLISCKPSQKTSIDTLLINPLDSLIQTQITEQNIPSIAIGIVKDRKSIYAKGFGFANVEKKIPATQFTVYELGSVSKMFTGHILAKLIAEGKMGLNDTLAHYFPEVKNFPSPPNGEPVKIREIATHSAEFPRYPATLQRVDPDPIKGFSKEELIGGIKQVKIDTMIGVRYQYSNFGYGVLGTAIENVMQQSLSDLMQEYIFTPYYMENSSLVLTNKIENLLAIPYLNVSPLTRTEPWDMGSMSAAGGVFSCIEDLNKFMIQMLDNEEIKNIQQKSYLTINDSWNYGLGCFVIHSNSKNTTIIYHGGDIDGYLASLTLYPAYDFGYVILTNWGEGQQLGAVFTLIDNQILSQYLDLN